MSALFAWILLGALTSSRPVSAGDAASDLGIRVTEWTCRGISVGVIRNMSTAGKIANDALHTDTVESFLMGETSNANMEFFAELKTSESVKRLVLMNIEENKIDLTHVARLFPDATKVNVYLGGKIDADLSTWANCRMLAIDGTISPRTLRSLLDLKRLEHLEFLVDNRIQYSDVEKLSQMKGLEFLRVCPSDGFKIPNEWLEKLDRNPRLRELIDPVKCSWNAP